MAGGVPRVPAPEEWLLKKRCPKCGETKPWARFAPRRYWPDGSVRSVVSYCRECNGQINKQNRAMWRQERSEQWVKLERRKLEWQRRRRRELAAERASNVNGGRRLPVEPIRMFLLDQINDGMAQTDISDVCGVPERTIHRLLHEHAHVSLRVADTIATRLGAHLYELYPEMMEDAAA